MKLGEKIKCKTDGVTGTIVARAEYLYSASQIAIPVPGDMKGEWRWMQETEADVISED